MITVYGTLSKRSERYTSARLALYLLDMAIRSARVQSDPGIHWIAGRGVGVPGRGDVPSALLGGMASPSDHALAVLALVGVVPSGRTHWGARPLAWLVAEERRVAAWIGGAS